MKKFLFIQLPIPRLKLSAEDHNLPVAAYCLQAYLQEQAIGRELELRMLATALQNYGSDETILQEILTIAPDVIGFSLFCWNIERSLALAAQIKQHRPAGQRPLMLAGGPEVTKDNPLLHAAAIDLYVYGEGEATLAAILAAWLADGRIPRHLPGTMYCATPKEKFPSWEGVGVGTHFRKSAAQEPTPCPSQEGNNESHSWEGHEGEELALFVNPPRLQPIDLNAAPSAYLQGLIPRVRAPQMVFETMRGCPFACHFCYYHKNGGAIRFLDQARVLALLEYALAHDYREIFLLDPSFNLRPDLKDLLPKIAALNPNRRIKIATELRSDLVTEEIAQLLADAGFSEVEIGLQSIHPATMRQLGRTQQSDAFLRGARAMLDRGIATKVDIIVGLPGDNLRKFEASARWVKRHGLDGDLQVFCLSILPGTYFRAQAEALGLKFAPFPPYYLRSSPDWATAEIQDAFRWAEDFFGVTFEPDTNAEWTIPSWEGPGVGLPSCEHDGTGVSLPGCGPRWQDVIRVAPGQPFHYPAVTPYITKWVLSPILSASDLFTHLAAMQTYTQRNPHGIYQVYLDLRREIPVAALVEFYSAFKPIRTQFIDRDLSVLNLQTLPLAHYRLALLIDAAFLPNFSEGYLDTVQQHFPLAIRRTSPLAPSP